MDTTWSYVRPNKDLESPFWAKHRHRHLPSLRPNNSSLVEDLYRLTTDTTNDPAAESSREELWVLCNRPFERACLKLRDIQESVTLESPLGADCLNLAVRNLVAEDADNFQRTKCMGWRHVYQVCKMDSTRADEYSCPEFTSSRFACDVFGAHLVLIPVVHDGHWSLYAFNMCDRKLSILDSSSLPYPEVRHGEIRRKISGVLNQTLATLSHGSQNDICSWECQFPMVPRQRNRNDCGFFVFNFMRLWDGHQLAQSFPEESRELRKDFLAYMMCFKENEASLPPLVATCISNLSEGRKMARKHCQTWAMYPMDCRLLQAAKRDNVEEFKNLLDSEIAPPSNANGRVDVVLVPNDAAAHTTAGHHAAGTDHGVAAASIGEGNQAGSQPIQKANENVGRIPMFFRRVTCGIVDRIDARHGGQRVQQPPQNAARGGEAVTREAPQATENAARGGEANGTVAVVVVRNNVAADTTAGHHAAATDAGVATSGETRQPIENDEARVGGEAETRVAQQSPLNAAGGGREADTWRVELVLLPGPDHAESRAIPRLSSMLLGGVTSAGNGVLHIAARQCSLDLVIHICSRAGIRIQRPRENAAAAAGGDTMVPLPAPAPASSSQHNQDTLPFAEFLRARNHKGETCLHEAVRSGCMDMVRLLMEVDAALNDEATPPLVQILDDNGASPLYLATTTSHDIVKALTVPYKYQVSHAGPAGKSALHAAVLSCDKESCKVLLDWKSSLATKQDESGRTPLHYTGILVIAITQLILEHDPSSGYIADSEGSLPIHVATMMGRLDVIKKLLEVCPNCDSACDAAGRTFLHVAVENSRANVVKYVCTDPKFRTILNMRDHNGDTALHMAVQKGSWISFCLFYRNNKVSLNSVNKQGRTPLDLAIINNTEKLNFKQFYWGWMRNDLLAAGAGFGPRERDDFPFKCSTISEHDKEKESKRLSKSAGLLAAVNLLILTISVQAPFDVADKLHSGKIGSTYSEKKRAIIFGDSIDYDGMVLVSSTISIFCFTVAGFPYAGLVARSMSLNAGGLWLWYTIVGFLCSFREGLSLVYSGGHGLTIVFVLVAATSLLGSVFAIVMSEPRRLFAHVLARLYRLGFGRWLSSLFRWHPAGSLTPLLNVIFLLLSCFLLWFGAEVCWNLPKDLKFVKSQKTVI